MRSHQPSPPLQENCFSFGSVYPPTRDSTPSHGVFGFEGFEYEDSSHSLLHEDALVPAFTSSDASGKCPGDFVQLVATMTAEYPQIYARKYPQFYALLEVNFDMLNMKAMTSSMDVVCVLDVSGSMSGSKIENLRRAVEFVISTLSQHDRLALVTFNQTATRKHGFLSLSEARKLDSDAVLRTLVAGGGTCLVEGMKEGMKILNERKEINKNTAMFLLTDGRDDYIHGEDEKIELARQMKAQGVSLNVFGFGADHDSRGLEAIADAAEGGFIYVETAETVIDAFGGVIGSMKGIQARDVTVSIGTINSDTKIRAANSGKYASHLNHEGTCLTVSFSNLYLGEKRNVLLNLSIDASQADVPQQNTTILVVNTHYMLEGEQVQAPMVSCDVSVIEPDTNPYNPRSIVRSVKVDAEVMRCGVMLAVKRAMALAERSQYEDAREHVEKTIAHVKSSQSYKQSLPSVQSLVDQLEACKLKFHRVTFTTGGGRAFTSECYNVNSTQRCGFGKPMGSTFGNLYGAYQSSGSTMLQRQSRFKQTC